MRAKQGRKQGLAAKQKQSDRAEQNSGRENKTEQGTRQIMAQNRAGHKIEQGKEQSKAADTRAEQIQKNDRAKRRAETKGTGPLPN